MIINNQKSPSTLLPFPLGFPLPLPTLLPSLLPLHKLLLHPLISLMFSTSLPNFLEDF